MALGTLAACLAVTVAAAPQEAVFQAIAQGDKAALQAQLAKNPALVNSVWVMPVSEWAGMKSRDPQEPEFQAKLSPLALAILGDRPDLVALLLAKGARTDSYLSFEGIKDPSLGLWESSALFLAVERGDPRMVKLLLDAKADPYQTVRYYGGPPPPPAGSAGPDRSLFGKAYYKDSRARLTVLDLCLVGAFRSQTIYRLLAKAAPRLKPRYLDRSLLYAALSDDQTLFDQLLDEGQQADGVVLAALMRNGNQNALHKLATQIGGLPDSPDWVEAGRLMAALDAYWAERILTKAENPGQWLLAARQEMVKRAAGLTGRLDAIERLLEDARPLLLSVGYPAGPPGLGFAGRFLFEPWLEPLRASQGGGQAALERVAVVRTCQALLVGSTLVGEWVQADGREWHLSIAPESIHNQGVDEAGRAFDAWLAPWRVALEDGLDGPDQDCLRIRYQAADKPWLALRRDADQLVLWDKEKGKIQRFVRRG